jgi:hypothetical protein
MKLHITPTVFFVPNSKSLVDSLFQGPNTASGTYKIRKNGVLFFKPTGEPFANKHGERFFVTAYRFDADGKMRYMHALTDEGERLLGVKGMPMSQEHEIAEKVWQVAVRSTHPETGNFRIIHTQGESIATVPKGDDLATHAAATYGFILNTSERRNRPHTGPEFAAAIADYFDPSEPHNAAIISHLQSI